MEIIIVEDDKQGCQIAFDIIKDNLLNKDLKCLGFATGSSPIPLYDLLSQSDLDFSKITSINLDEYVGLNENDEHSYHYFMKEYLFNQKDFKVNYLPDGMAKDLQQACLDYDQIIEENPIDIQILGIGNNAHIAFNEPGTPFALKTHIVDLSQSTIVANKRFFHMKEEVPEHALSMGISSILSAKKIILFAWGKDKANAINQMINGPITLDVPASSLQSHHDVILIIDKEAASLLGEDD